MPCGGFGERVVNTMAESKNYIVQPQEGGNILISEDVIASIASLAVREVEGVYGLSATQTLDLTAILGKKNLSSRAEVGAGLRLCRSAAPRRRAAVLHFHFTYQGDMT